MTDQTDLAAVAVAVVAATKDWARDLDILDQRYIDDPFSVW